MISDLASQGIAVIMISSDLPEVLAMSDRVLVMREGRQMAILDRAEATEEIGDGCGDGRTACVAAEATEGIAMKTLISRFRPEQIRLLFLLVLMIIMVVFFSHVRSRATSMPASSTASPPASWSSRCSPSGRRSSS